MDINPFLLVQEFGNLGRNLLIHILVWSVFLDIVTGFVRSWIVGRNIDSTVGLKGLAKHFLMLLIILIVYPYLEIAHLHQIGVGVAVFYIAFYGLSIVENLGQLGLPLPPVVKERFEKLKKKKEETK
ncbi:hypothetical protein X560_0370 [Listeria fleischmannii 1991]|uniref:Phage-related holin (Lysis protein) n=2 Tax=Listeria fleischmannii TaxID=1069827 RepID=A0A2X3J8R6_9LIST|nr:phage holin family protein [Listeria fleischmannii]EMG27087.1 holin [Listeria fleischmannii subsp. fleischmannii LU2006-1]KMT60950.1 hypothetical protein X560_0370 [Listeria fleischmannii 1991]SQC70610.1 Phage-related holin (Lysis protein) [Listeria fleischmannii subsp. fleischmannii]